MKKFYTAPEMKENNAKVDAFLEAISIVNGNDGDDNDAKAFESESNSAEYGNLW